MLIKQEIEKANADAKLEDTRWSGDIMKFIIKLAGIITATALLVNTTIADAATDITAGVCHTVPESKLDQAYDSQ